MFIKDIYIDWERISEYSYLRDIKSINGIEKLTLNKPITFFVGENGSGKSTLLEAIAIADGFNPEGGTKNYSFSTFDSHSELCDAIRLSRVQKARWGYFLRAESFYNVASKEDEYSKGSKAIPLELHKQSHGESFLTVVHTSFKDKGLYLLDEPEAALSPQRQLSLLIEIDRCLKEESQFIIVTHSPILLGMPNAEILNFDDSGINSISYEETDSYRITSMFVNNREQLLNQLLEE